jgi:hypothetical protein
MTLRYSQIVDVLGKPDRLCPSSVTARHSNVVSVYYRCGCRFEKSARLWEQKETARYS